MPDVNLDGALRMRLNEAQIDGFVIDCYCDGSELPENTYSASTPVEAADILRRLLDNDQSGIHRVVLTDNRFARLDNPHSLGQYLGFVDGCCWSTRIVSRPPRARLPVSIRVQWSGPWPNIESSLSCPSYLEPSRLSPVKG